MSYAHDPSEPIIPMVSSWSGWGYLSGPIIYSGAPSSTNWEADNTVVYQPIIVPRTCVIRRVWWANGSSVSSQNISAAVYASTSTGIPGSKLVECGATAQGSASEVQFVDVTDTVIAPGLYWIALAAASTSSTTILARVTSLNFDAFVRFQEAGITVGALPATATPVESYNTALYLFGFATTASP